MDEANVEHLTKALQVARDWQHTDDPNWKAAFREIETLLLLALGRTV